MVSDIATRIIVRKRPRQKVFRRDIFKQQIFPSNKSKTRIKFGLAE